MNFSGRINSRVALGIRMTRSDESNLINNHYLKRSQILIGV